MDDFSLEDDSCLTSRTSPRLTLDDILSFCQPVSIEHPQATLRLFLLADNGPARHLHSFLKCLCRRCHQRVSERMSELQVNKTDEDKQQQYKRYRSLVRDQALINPSLDQEIFEKLCEKCCRHITHDLHLISGRAGQSIVTDQEISVMGQVQEINDAISIYFPVHYLSFADCKQFLGRIPKRLRSYPNLSRSDLADLLQPLFLTSKEIEFRQFSEFMHEYRIKTLQSMADIDYPNKELIKEHQRKLSRRRPIGHDHNWGDSANQSDIVHLLHRYSWQITDCSNRGAANINVRVLLDRAPDSFYRWDGNFIHKLNDSI